MNKNIYLVILFFILNQLILADSMAPNQKYVAYSSNGKFMIEMTPTSEYEDEGEGNAYTAIDSAKGEFLWKVDWYGYIALMDDGEHLVRFGPWAWQQAEFTDLAIAFYKKGVLIKEYLVKDLLKDKTTITETASHYYWKAKTTSVPKGFSEDRSTYTIVTSDKIVYIFDIYSGAIKETFVDSLAKSEREIQKEEDAQRRDRALKLLNNTANFRKFEKYFVLKKDYNLGCGYSIDTTEQLFGNIYPRKKGEYNWACSMEIDISEDSLLLDLDPMQIYIAYDDFISSPVIRKFLNNSKNIEMFVQVGNDRLFRRKPKINLYYSLLLKHNYLKQDTKEWMEVTINFRDYDKNDIITFYHPFHSDYYILEYLTALPKAMENKELTNGDDVYFLYCLHTCTVIDKNGNARFIPWMEIKKN